MKTQNKKGFTIIEVVLVLAIAALIFLVVFLAVPALQKGQRDQQRRSDLSRLQTKIENYRSNNKGQLPGNPTPGVFDDGFLDKYLRPSDGSESFSSPGGDPYHFSGWPTGALPVYNPALKGSSGVGTPTGDVIFYKTGVKCGTAEGTTTPGGTRDYALGVALEGGGSTCQSN